MMTIAPMLANGCAHIPSETGAAIVDIHIIDILAIADTILKNPLITFGIGCATGAALAGLTVGLAGRSARMRLEGELQDAQNATQRAEGTLNRAEAMLEAYRRELREERTRLAAAQDELRALDMLSEDEDDSWRASEEYYEEEELSDTNELEVIYVDEEEEEEQPQVVAPPVAPEVAAAEVAAVEVEPQTTGARRRQLLTATGHLRRTVAEVLRERLGANPLGDLPVIERAPARALEDTLSRRVETSAPAPAEVTKVLPAKAQVAPEEPRQRSAAERARIIDRRIARFDESLFPDLTSEHTEAVDPFERAMVEMESHMPQGGVTVVTAAEASAPARPINVPEVSDAASSASRHLEELVAEELEANREGAGVRYSRSKLTVFEGTGDLAAPRRAPYRPRHFAMAAAEA